MGAVDKTSYQQVLMLGPLYVYDCVCIVWHNSVCIFMIICSLCVFVHMYMIIP